MIRRTLTTRSSGIPFSGGFTIVELMVSLALVAISAALALPSYQSMLEKRRLTSGVEQLAAFINSAQTEAVRRNELITVSYKRNSHESWCVGAVDGEDDCDCRETRSNESDYCAIDGVHRVLNNNDFGDAELMHKMEGNDSFTFDPVRGMLLEPDDAMFMELHTDDRDYKLNIMVSASGEVTACSKDAEHDIAGYHVCPSN